MLSSRHFKDSKDHKDHDDNSGHKLLHLPLSKTVLERQPRLLSGRRPLRSRQDGPHLGMVICLALLLLAAIILALPNFFGDDWVVQISTREGAAATQSELASASTTSPQQLLDQATQLLATQQLKPLQTSLLKHGRGVELSFGSSAQQLAARDLLQNAMPDCVVALGLATRTPHWLQLLGAVPVRLGLDLRGGVHLLLTVDLERYWLQYYKQQVSVVSDLLQQEAVKQAATEVDGPAPALPGQANYQLKADEHGVRINLVAAAELQPVQTLLASKLPDYELTQADQLYEPSRTSNQPSSVTPANTPAPSGVHQQPSTQLLLTLKPAMQQQLSERVLDQTLQVIEKRVNELGVSEAVVQRQGSQQISVDLPGLLDTARAKELLGKTANLRFQLLAQPTMANAEDRGGGYESYDYANRRILVQPETVLDGSAIIYATAATDQWGKPAVQVELAANMAEHFHQVTAANIGQAMATIYSQMQRVCRSYNGQQRCFQLPEERVVNVATIQSALHDRFEITGLASVREAEDLALLLRSGTLAAPISIDQEVVMGPSAGAENIARGGWSLVIGLAAIAIFMVSYYGWFGLLANCTLCFNLIFMLAALSLLDATLTLAGMAGMVLTVGMAVDASVLILERIREELRAGYGPYTAIQLGYRRALATILDSNLSTLIVAAALFSLASGAIKGFAVVLTVGLVTSMLTAVTYFKLLAELFYKFYGRQHWGQRLPIGIKLNSKTN